MRVRTQDADRVPEPGIRINTDLPEAELLNFDEAGAWDGIAEYYLALTRPSTSARP